MPKSIQMASDELTLGRSASEHVLSDVYHLDNVTI